MRQAGTAGPGDTLRAVVHRAHLSMALLAVALAGVLLLVAGLVALRVYAMNNLQLVARSLAYTVEAAVVFGDREDASETLRRMVADEGVAEARVTDAHGAVFAEWHAELGGLKGRLAPAVASLVGLAPVAVPIRHEGEDSGAVMLRSDGLGLLYFIGTGMAALALCLAVSGAVGLVLSRRMLRDMVVPLQALATVARSVRRDHVHGLRVPPARIAELDALGDDFNALLAELERREALLEQRNVALTHQALHDGLTGLSNRSHFEQHLQSCLEEARGAGTSLALLFLDNDHFKAVNDTHGHAAGDALLVAVAQRLRSQARETDLVARLGGDEFAIVMAPVGGPRDAERMVARVQEAMRDPVALEGGLELQPAVSIGVAVFPLHAGDMGALMRFADMAMYRVKAERRGGLRSR
ncbi:diguanylate cyclase domain-containing protein [Acidovorax sacchari]|uniref:diguanylate cyclase domain-containing protein n=1 Tax=Acidovorax sacchari TaxID=3230736 RepID=UPI0039E336EA